MGKCIGKSGGGRGGGGAAPAGKTDEFQPHPVMEQLPGIPIPILSNATWPETLFLAFQNYLVALGMVVFIPTFLVPQMGGGNKEKAEVIQTLLFVTALNTLLQSCLGTRLPAVMGPSPTYIIPTLSIICSPRYSAIVDPHLRFLSTMRAIQGALVIASLFQMIISFLKFPRKVVWLMYRLSRFPLALFGSGLCGFGFAMVTNCVEIGLPQLILMVFISQYLPRLLTSKRAAFDGFVVSFSITIVWIFTHILTVGGAYDKRSTTTEMDCCTDPSGLLSAAPWVRVPYPFQWVTPTFHAREAFAMMHGSLLSLIESTGTFIAVSRYVSTTPIPPSVLSRGIGWQGFGILLEGLFGTVTGSAASIEHTGLLALSQVGSRRVIQVTAGIMFFFSIFGKLVALFAFIPVTIFAALYCIFFSYAASAGHNLLQFCNLNSFRTLFVLGLSLFIGILTQEYYKEVANCHYPFHAGSRTFSDMVNVIFLLYATVAVIVAVILDCVCT